MMKTIEFKWDLLERIKRNSEDWELEEGNESGTTRKKAISGAPILPINGALQVRHYYRATTNKQ